MASVLHLSQLQLNHLFSETEPLSLSLDLSLGGLFSKQNSNLHLSVDSLKASQNSNSSVKKFKACATPPLGINNCNKGLDPSNVEYIASLPSASHEPAELLRTRNLAQRRHEARKRRKSIIEGKLHKRAKGDNQCREELTAPSNTQYLEVLTPGCAEGIFRDANKVNREESMSREGVRGSAHAESISSWAVQSKDVSVSHTCSMPAAMVDYMNVLGSENDVRYDIQSSAYSDVGCDMPVDGDVGYVCESSNSLQHVVASEVYKQDVPSDGKQGLSGDVSSAHPSVLSCASSGQTFLTSCVPYASGQKKQPFAQSATQAPHGGNAHFPQVTIPTRGSSSELLSWHAGERHNITHSSMGSGDNSDCMDRCCNSSSSEIENANATGDRKHNSRLKEEAAHVEQAPPSISMPAGVSMAYPHSFPVMPIPYPYGVPLPWGYSLPWFTPSSAQNAFGVPIAPPPLKEAFSIPMGGFPTPYHLPVPGSNISTPWIPFVPTSGLGTSTSSESSIPTVSNGEMYKTLHPDYKSEKIPDFGQDTKPRDDSVSAFDMWTASVDEDKDGNNALSQAQGENAQAEHARLDEPMKGMEERSSGIGDCRQRAQAQIDKPVMGDSPTVESSRLCLKEDKMIRQAASEKMAAGMRQSIPLAKGSASKRKKVVRFNSLDGAPAPSAFRGGNEASQSVDGMTDSISSSQQSGGAFSGCTQTDAVPSNDEHSQSEAGPPSCAEVRRNPNHIEECMSSNKKFRVGDEHSADDVMHANGRSADGEIDDQIFAGDGSATLGQCKSDIKDNMGSQSLASLPRVITRGLGPHAKTIHGVMYITKEKQARLICICHGKHMSPLEFVRHSGSTDLSNPERSIVLEPFTFVDHEVSVPS